MPSLIEEEYEEFTEERKWPQVYARLKNEASLLHSYPCLVARSAENRERNRYRDVSPYDDFRVKLQGEENDYVNASLVEVPLIKRKYILTQGPLAHTSGHFWLMVWQQRTKGVLMLNKVIEDGRLKCHPYFPEGSHIGGKDVLDYPETNMRVEFIAEEDFSYFVKRTLKLVNLENNEERMILQFHYISWPDFGVPSDSETFLSFLYTVRQSGVIPSEPGEVGPPVIHCSAGIGRSGTFCLVDSALVLVERTRSLQALDVRSMLMDMRKYRCGLIQTADQLRFSYMAILDGAHAILSEQEHSATALTAESDDNPDQLSSEASSDGNESDDDDSDTNTTTTKPPLEVPEPPARTSSLETETPAKKVCTESGHDDAAVPPSPVPDPPRRTSSLVKAASVDNPPPLPPRPPHTYERQTSAPPVPEAPSTADSTTEEDSLVTTTTSPIRRKREERKQRTEEMIRKMREKQIAAELLQESPWWRSRSLWIGAATAAAVLAVGIIYLH